MNLEKSEIYSESYLTLVINSILPLAVLVIALCCSFYFGILIYIFFQFLVIYATGLISINTNYIEIKYVFRKPKRIDFNKISHIKFHQGTKAGLNLLLISKDNKVLKVIDEKYRPTLVKIINHLHEKGVRVQMNEHWIQSIQLKNGKYLINDK